MLNAEKPATPLRVAFVSFGSFELSVRLASALSRHATVQLSLPGAQTQPFLRWLDPAVDYRPFDLARLRQPLRQCATIIRLWRQLRAFRPDVIHFQKWHLWFFLALPLFRKFPLVISVHDPIAHLGDADSQRTPHWVVALGYRAADWVIVHNHAMVEEATRLHHIDRSRIDVVPLVERGDGTLRPDVLERPEEVLFFGRIWAYKGLEYLIDAAPMVAESVPGVRFVIAGKGDEIDPYVRMMEHPERFEIINRFVEENEQAELFRRAAVVVLPYVEATQSGVIPVAASFGKAVVATAVGGIPEQVDNGRTGLLVPPRDPRALADAITTLLLDPVRRRSIGEAARKKAQNEWSADAVARRTVDVYRRVLAEIAPSKAPPGEEDVARKVIPLPP